MLTLYYSPGACSLASHIALEEIGAPFEARRVMIREGEHLQDWYLKINPHGRVPALTDGDRVITENVAILNYLARSAPNAGLLPEDEWQAARVNERLSYFASTVHIAFAQVWRPARFIADADPATLVAYGHDNVRRLFAELETYLEGQNWVANDTYSVADSYMLVFYRWGGLIGIDMGGFKSWTMHSQRMLARPAVQRAVEREGIQII
jgi:glutathione S-transferase